MSYTTVLRRESAHKPPRTIFVAAILFGHGLIVLLLLGRAQERRVIPESDIGTLPIYITPMTPRTTRNQTHKVATTRSAPRDAETSINPPITPTPPAPGVPTPPNPPIDWASEAQQAARRAAQPDERAQFIRRDESILRPGPAQPARGDRPHRAGDIEMVGPGIERRWISENCYWEFGRPPPLFTGPLPRLHQVHCKPGALEPAGDLFDEIKPGYLKEKDAPDR